MLYPLSHYKRDLTDPFKVIQREFDDFFKSAFDSLMTREYRERGWNPLIDISEEKDHYFVTADLPGIKLEDIKVSLENNMLTIKGERKSIHDEKKEECFLSERCFGKFQRTFQLPGNVSPDLIKAEYNQGVLEITIPKTEEEKPKEIEIKVHH